MKIQGEITWKLNIKTVYGSVKSSQSVSESIVPVWVEWIECMKIQGVIT